MKKLWCDLRSDAERSDYILSGQAYDAGIIAHAIQADVAMAFHRCSEYDAEVRRLREENERQRFDILAMNQSLDLLREENGRLAKPIPVATPAVPASSVPEEWREVLRECADDLAIELDMRYQSRSHYPSELRKYENEMQPVYRARALLQSTGDKK